MEKVVYVLYYKNGDVYRTEMIEEARLAFENGDADVCEIRRRTEFVGRVEIETKITFRW